MLWGVQGFFFNPPSKDKQALAEFFFACIRYVLAKVELKYYVKWFDRVPLGGS